MKLEATSHERVKRGADAPVERQKAAGLAGCRSGHFGPLHDSDVNPALTKEIGRAGADNSTAADHNVHGFSADPFKTSRLFAPPRAETQVNSRRRPALDGFRRRALSAGSALAARAVRRAEQRAALSF